MKRLYIYLVCVLVSFSVAGQETDSLSKENNPGYTISEEGEEIEITTEEVIKEAPLDTTDIKFGNKKVRIIEDEEETRVIIKDKDEENTEPEDKWDFDWDKDVEIKSNKRKFKGHWAGFEFGLNNYVDKDFSISRTPENEFLDINTGRSWNFNINFAQYSIPIASDRFGIITGMGIEWNNYHFSNPNTIIKNTITKRVEPLPISATIKKNRLQTTYLTVPILLELQLLGGNRSDRLFLSGGVIGGIKIASNTKYKITESGNKSSKIEWLDYYINPFRYGVTARAGYKLVKLYFNYYMTPLFVQNRGPELYPITIGVSFTF